MIDCTLVVKVRDDVDKTAQGTLTRPVFKYANGCGDADPNSPEMHSEDLPLGAMFVKSNGSVVIKIPQTPDHKFSTFFSPTEEKGDGSGWTVSGDNPNITVHPSVWVAKPHGWHGWIKGGKLYDANEQMPN